MAWLIWDSKTEVLDLKMLRYSRFSKDKGVSKLTQPDLRELLSALLCFAGDANSSASNSLGENSLTLAALE